MSNKKSFFERLTGGLKFKDHEDEDDLDLDQEDNAKPIKSNKKVGKFEDDDSSYDEEENYSSKKNSKEISMSKNKKYEDEPNEDEEEGQLTVDLYHTPNEIVLQTMIAGVRPDTIQITITRDMVTLRGKREESKIIHDDNYLLKELYWGSFSRSIILPQEIIPEDAEASEKHGLLTIKMPKVDKERKTTLRIKSV